VSNQNLWQYCAHNIFSPLGMTGTSFANPALPDPGPDPDEVMKNQQEEVLQQKLSLERAEGLAAKQAEMAEKSLKAKDKSGQSAKKNTMFAQMILQKEIEKERERQENAAKDERWRKKHAKKLAQQRKAERAKHIAAVARGETMPRPKGWKGSYPPMLWQVRMTSEDHRHVSLPQRSSN